MGRVSSHAVSRRSWSPGCCGFRGVFSVGRLFRVFFFRLFFFFERTRPAASVRPPCLIYLSTICVFRHERQIPPAQNLEVSLVWAREAIAMRTYINVVLCVLPLLLIKMRCESHAFLGPQYKNLYFQKSKPVMRLSLPSAIFVGMTSPRHQVQPLKSLTSYR